MVGNKKNLKRSRYLLFKFLVLRPKKRVRSFWVFFFLDFCLVIQVCVSGLILNQHFFVKRSNSGCDICPFSKCLSLHACAITYPIMFLTSYKSNSKYIFYVVLYITLHHELDRSVTKRIRR